MNLDELNVAIENPICNLTHLKGLEIIAESFVYKIYDIFGRNSLLSMLYQVGAGPGETISERIKEKFQKEEFEIDEALKLLLTELKDFYKIKFRTFEEDNQKIRLTIENHCFLRETIKRREKLKPGKALCRINKGYFEVALKRLVGDKIKRIEINFLENNDEHDVCIEELCFYKY